MSDLLNTILKKLIIINGVPGVGKTTTARHLHNLIGRSAWLDGDWCWKLNPYAPNTENRKMVENNIINMINAYLSNSNVDMVIFSWVLPDRALLNRILNHLESYSMEAYLFTLICSRNALQDRMIKQGRDLEKIKDSLLRQNKSSDMDTVKIDTSSMKVEEIVQYIQSHIEEKQGAVSWREYPHE